MLKFLLSVFICSTAFAATVTEAVSLDQKGTEVKVTVSFDAKQFLADFEKIKTELNKQRQASLADKKQRDVKGKETTVALTPEQKNFVNNTFDARFEDEKRKLILRFMDQAIKNLQVSGQRMVLDDADVIKARADARAKVDAEFDQKEKLKPALNVDAIKP